MKGTKIITMVSLLIFGLGFLGIGTGLAQKKVTVTFVHPYGPPHSDFYQKGAEAVAEKYPWMEVKVQMIPWDGLMQKLATMVAAGNPPDVVHLFGTFMALQLAQMGLLQNLDSFISKDSTWNPNDIYPGYIEAMTYKGKLYGLPGSSHGLTLAWNKDLFAEAGLNSEVPPKSLDEVLEFQEKIYKTDARGKIVAFGFIPNNLWGGFPAWAYLWGGSFYDKETGKITASDPVNVKALQWQIDFFEKYGGIETVSSWQQGFVGAGNDPFVKGKLGMALFNHYQYTFIHKYSPKDFLEKSVGYTSPPEFPGPDTLPKGHVCSSNAHVLLKGSEHPEAAYTFLKEIACGVGHLYGKMKYGCYVAANRKINERYIKEIGLPDWFPKQLWDLEIRMQEFKRAWPSIPVVSKLQDELGAQTQIAYRGKKSAEDALKYVDRIVQRELEKVLRK